MDNSQDTILEYLLYIEQFNQQNIKDAYRLEAASNGIKSNIQYNEGYYRKFAQYALPPYTKFSRLDPEDAPRNITLTRTEDGKYLLVQKVFKVKEVAISDGMVSAKNKEPYVSIRMLAGLPKAFSLKDAIMLGESDIWQDFAAPKNLYLKILSLKNLKEHYINRYSETPISTKKIEKSAYVLFIIKAYLMQRIILEKRICSKPRILIIASPDLVAYLITMLSKSIPSRLSQGITFSTYEYDIQHQEYDICGTCLFQEEQNKYEKHLHLSTTYTNDFVLNTYAQNSQTCRPTNLPPDLWEKTSRYADFVLETFTDVSSYNKLHSFTRSHEDELSVDAFLDSYLAYFHAPPQTIPLNKIVKTEADPVQKDPASATWPHGEQKRYPKNPAQDPQVPTSSVTSYTTQAVPPTAFQQSPVPFNKIDDPIPPVPSIEPRPIETFSPAPFQQAPVAPDKVKYPLQQTPEPSKEIPLESIQDLAQDMSRPASSLSADVLPATFSSEEDGDDSSQKSIQEYLNNSGSLPTLEESSSKKLSHEEILEELDDPRRAEKLLENTNKHKYMIALMLNDPAWTQNYVSPALKRLREIASTGKPRKLSSAINKLIHHIYAIAIQAMRENNQILFQECLFILPFISPYLEDKNLWRIFLDNLSQEQKYTTFLQNNWSYRERLLSSALKVLDSEKKDHDKIVQPLLKVDPKDFSKLISASSPHATPQNYTSLKRLLLPKRWNYLATQVFLTSISANDPAIQSAVIQNVRYFEKYQEILDSLFGHFISLQEPYMWNTIIPFFKILVEANYKHQKNILFELLEANTPQVKKIELIRLVQATLLAEDKVNIFKLNESLCIEHFLSDPLFREITLYSLPHLPLTWERMNALYLTLEKGSLKNVEAVIDRLAAIVNDRMDSPIRLGMFFSSFTREDNATAKPLLLSMAQQTRDEMTWAIDEIASDKESTVQRIQSRFSMYVQFALQLDTSYQGSIKGHDMLSRLLHGADERIFSFLTYEANYWLPEPRQAWYEQKDNYPSSSLVLEVEDAPITANDPVADPSLALRTIEIELSAEQNKLRRRMERLLEKRVVRKLSQFWQENYIALQKIKGESNNRDILDALEILERAYNYSFAIKNADRIAEGSEKKRQAERAIVLAHTAIFSYNDDLRFTRKEDKRFNLACERTEQTQNMHDPTKDKTPYA